MERYSDFLHPTLLSTSQTVPFRREAYTLGHGAVCRSGLRSCHRSAAAGRASQLVHSGRYPILLQNGPDSGLTCA
jgi:hypothetical protein